MLNLIPSRVCLPGLKSARLFSERFASCIASLSLWLDLGCRSMNWMVASGAGAAVPSDTIIKSPVPNSHLICRSSEKEAYPGARLCNEKVGQAFQPDQLGPNSIIAGNLRQSGFPA